MTIFRFTCMLLSACALHAAELPSIPPSERILGPEEVKNYWLNALPMMELPAKGSGLHPEQTAIRQREIRARKSLIGQIKKGAHDIDAKLASLRHNADAHTRRGEGEKAQQAETRLWALREHLSKLATLKAQRETAEKLGEATDQIASLEAEISSLRQAIGNQTNCNPCE